MKAGLKFKLSLSLVGLLFLGAYHLRAQEENFSSPEQQELKQHPELNLEDDKTLIMIEADQSAKPAKAMPSTGKDTNNNSTKTKSEASKSAAKEKAEEDPLNFNFLYFIIQRFKISDIVDD